MASQSIESYGFGEHSQDLFYKVVGKTACVNFSTLLRVQRGKERETIPIVQRPRTDSLPLRN